MNNKTLLELERPILQEKGKKGKIEKVAQKKDPSHCCMFLFSQ